MGEGPRLVTIAMSMSEVIGSLRNWASLACAAVQQAWHAQTGMKQSGVGSKAGVPNCRQAGRQAGTHTHRDTLTDTNG